MATHLSKNWKRALVTAYAELFHPNGDPPVARGWPEVDESWRDLLVRVCIRLRAAVRDDGGSFRATQIKEKFSTLRFY